MVETPDAGLRNIEATVQARGHTVAWCDEGEAAWAAYTRLRPHLVVLTAITPESAALCRRIRETDPDERVLVLGVVPPGADALRHAVEAGVDDGLHATDDPAYLEACLTLIERRVNNRTQWQQIEQELRESETKFRTLAENIPGVAYLCLNDEAYSMLYVNDAVAQLTGFPKEDFLEHRLHFGDLIHPDDRERIAAAVDAALAERRAFHLQYRIRHRSEAWRWVEEKGVGVFDDGDVEYLEGFISDITERKQVEEALRESEARTRAILDTTVDGIITIDERGLIETYNPAAEQIFGYAPAEVLGSNITMLMPLPYAEEHDGYLRNYLETGHRKIIGIGREVLGLRKDGSVFPLDLAVSEFWVGERRLFTGVVRDVTERRRLEQEILRISEEERRRIGQDLHDELGQMLTGIGLINQNLARTMEAQGHPGADDVAEVTDLIKKADQHARTLARGLIPVDLEAAGLSSALQRLALNAEQWFAIRCTFDEAGAVLIHDNSVATHLYRIAQEGISNAVRHGKARRVRISLASGNGRLRLRIHDDGTGFPDHLDDDNPGMGVRIMHYRARIIGATLEIGARPGGGTTITCTLQRTPASTQSPDSP